MGPDFHTRFIKQNGTKWLFNMRISLSPLHKASIPLKPMNITSKFLVLLVTIT